jgi:hypothetical protein
MSRWRRILTWSAIAVVVFAICAWLFGVQIAIALETRYLARESPVMWKVPVELVDASISESPGEKLSYLGCEFEVPWNDLDQQKTRLVGKWQIIWFGSGKGIILKTIPAKERVNAFLELDQKPDAESLRKLKYLYGDETLRSDYAFSSAVLDTTPRDISIFTSRKEAIRAMILLVFKPIVARDADSGIYAIQTKDFRGFQYGNPQSRQSEIDDELFSDNELLEFTFRCRGKGGAGCISQSEINRVIQSARVVH